MELKSLWAKRLLDSKVCIECDPCCDDNWDYNFEALRALWKIEELYHHIKTYHGDNSVPHEHQEPVSKPVSVMMPQQTMMQRPM